MKLNASGKCMLLALFASGAATLSAQNTSIQANIRGGGGDSGKCTIEVEVDGTAEIQILGTEARMRTLTGTPANFRRMDCNAAMPRNPGNFRFQGVDGRGSQQLVSAPNGRNGAIVRIDDPKGGREGYTFDITWSGGSNSGGWNNGGGWNDNGNGGWNNGRGDRNDRYDRDRYDRGDWTGNARGWDDRNAQQAMRACQNEVVNRIRRGGQYSDVQFLRADFDNNRNRADRITGTARAIQTFGNDRFDFTCRVDFSTGRLGDVRIDRR